MKWANTWLRRGKDERDQVPWLDSLPFEERCSSCNLRPVSVRHSLPGRPLCSVCRLKSEQAHNLSRNSRSSHLEANIYAPHDLAEIGQACQARAGYIGFIYLDGDAMGQRFEQVSTSQDARDLSEAIRKASQQTVEATLDNYIKPMRISPSEGRQETHRDQPNPNDLDRQGRLLIDPHEQIIAGGDDIVLIVPGDLAIPLACQISQHFQQSLSEAVEPLSLPKSMVDQPFTLSGGVVIADDHNPVRALRDLAIELKSSAKRARHKANAEEGYLDFLVLRGTDMPDRRLSASRELYPYLIEQPGTQPLQLIGRPYPVSDLLAAWNELVALRKQGFPNSQMGMLSDTLLKGMQESSLLYHYQRQRQQRQENFAHLDEAIRLLLGQNPALPFALWQVPNQPSRIGARTALWDIAELYSLVAG